MKWIKSKDKNFIILKIAASMCLLIFFHIFFVAKNIWHYNSWSDVLALFCIVFGVSMLVSTLRDFRDLSRKGKIPLREDERSKMIIGKSSTNAFLAMIIALPFLATFFTTSEIMDINLFAAVLIVMGVSVFIASAVYYNR